MKKGKIIGIAVTCLLSASALICGGIFLHQYFDAQNSAAAFDELAGLVVEVTPLLRLYPMRKVKNPLHRKRNWRWRNTAMNC